MYNIYFTYQLFIVFLQRETIHQMDYKNLEMLSWLVAQFRRAGETGITFDQLIDKLVDEPNMEKILPKRTFHNYLKELRNRFGIKIECDNRLQHEVGKKALSEENRRYRYRLVEVPRSDSNPWIMPFLMAFETSAAMRQLQISEENKMYMYIDCKATGVENVNILMDAIRQQKSVDLYYHHPRTGFAYHQELFEPRGLVLKDYVWYVLGHTRYRMETIWPLYLLTGIKITDTSYRPYTGFSPERFWNSHKNLWQEHLSNSSASTGMY